MAMTGSSKATTQSKKSAAGSSKTATQSKKSAAGSSKTATQSKKSAAGSSKTATQSKKSAAGSSKTATQSKKSAAGSSKTATQSKKSAAGSSKTTTQSKKSVAGSSKTATQSKKSAKVNLLSGGNPQIAKASGNAPVQKYINAIPSWKREIGERIDSLVDEHVPQAIKAVKWNSPFYGIKGQGWFLSFHVFTNYVKLTFFNGVSLKPAPTGGSSDKAKWIDIHEDDFDEVQISKWLKQAAKLPGWGQC